jgi:tetratricopeptide (TPR) repeat protein
MQLSTIHSPLRSDSVTALSERAHSHCALARKQEEAGDFETACGTIREFWERVGDSPRVDGLDEVARGEVLLRAGALSGWIGSARQIFGAQELAKDLISESATVFENLGLVERVAEARIDLAICYWREGGYDEARVTLRQALDLLGDRQSEQSLRALLNSALIERSSMRYREALHVHKEAALLFEKSSNHALRGKFHNEYATVLKNLGLAENREDYIDQALIEYAAASFHGEQAGNKRFLALVENNVGFLFVRLGRFGEAHEHLDRARTLFVALGDNGMIAQVDDTRAKAFLEQGRYAEAETVARGSIRVLEEGDEQSLLAEALTTHGTALARLRRNDEALGILERAMKVAAQGGDPDGGGIAALTIAEELGSIVLAAKLLKYYKDAESMLARSQHPGIQLRLGECARRILSNQEHGDAGLNDKSAVAPPSANGNGSNESVVDAQSSASNEQQVGCSLEEAVLRYEGELIKRALEASGGSVTRAARILGITHQGLAFILNGRHSSLLSVRTPIRRRRRSIIRYRR